MLWLGAATGPAVERDRWLGWARKFSERLRPRLASDSSSRALLFYYGAALGSILCGDRDARSLALEAAGALAKMYNPRAGVLPLGGAFEEVSHVGATEAEIDMVQAVALLMWACHESWRPQLERNRGESRAPAYRLLSAPRRFHLPVRHLRSSDRRDDPPLHPQRNQRRQYMGARPGMGNSRLGLERAVVRGRCLS